MVSKVRGVGTFAAFDLPTTELRDTLIQKLRLKGTALSILFSYSYYAGVNSGGSGDKSIRLRPMLIFKPKHAQQFLSILSQTLSQL